MQFSSMSSQPSHFIARFSPPQSRHLPSACSSDWQSAQWPFMPLPQVLHLLSSDILSKSVNGWKQSVVLHFAAVKSSRLKFIS